MKKKWNIGCLVVILYCAGCSIFVGVTGGFVSGIAVFATLRGGHNTMCDLIICRVIDVVTAPVQVAVLGPLLAVQYVQEHTGERGRQRAEIERQEAMFEQYVEMLNENIDRIYVEDEFLNPANTPAMRALDSVKSKFDADRKLRFAELLLEHRELMIPQREFWRMCKVSAPLQRRALSVALDLAEKNPSEDVKWLLWGVMNVCAEECSPGREPPYTFSDEKLREYATNQVEIVRWSAQECLKGRESYRDHLRRHEEHQRQMHEGK